MTSTLSLSDAFKKIDEIVNTVTGMIQDDKSLKPSERSTCFAYLDDIAKHIKEIKAKEAKIQSQNALQTSFTLVETQLNNLREKANQLKRLPEENKKLKERLDDRIREKLRLSGKATEFFEEVHGRPSPLFNL